MGLHVQPHHPLQELLAQLLSGIETVPAKEQRRMVNRVCKEAIIWHENHVSKMKSLLNRIASETVLGSYDGHGNQGRCWSCAVLSGDRHLGRCLFNGLI